MELSSLVIIHISFEINIAVYYNIVAYKIIYVH